MPAVFPSWFNSRPVSSLTGRVRKSLTAHWLIMLPMKRHFNVGRADVRRLRSPGRSSWVIDKQPVNAPKFAATSVAGAIAGKEMHKWYLRLRWQNEMVYCSVGWERQWECGGGGGRGREEVMDSPTSCGGEKVWLMAGHSAKHTSCERR